MKVTILPRFPGIRGQRPPVIIDEEDAKELSYHAITVLMAGI